MTDNAGDSADPSTGPVLYDSLDGQVALVTGANRGIGRAIARNLADLGATVYAGVRRAAADAPGDARRVSLDVTQEGEIQAALNQIGEEAGRLDVLVNNAAVGSGDGRLHEVRTADLERCLSVNLRGPMLLCKYALPPLLRTGAPRIVNLSSGMGALSREQSGGSPGYRITKTGLNGLTRYLHGEYADDGLIANSVCPGWVRTEMGGEEAPRSPEKGAETPTWLARFERGPGGRFWRDESIIEW